jgi:holo-[acyl-carrier protein] synthase
MDPVLDVIARIARVEPESLKPEMTLGAVGLHTSLGLGIVRSALERRFKRELRPLTWETTIGQVQESLDKVAQASSPAVSTMAGEPRLRPAERKTPARQAPALPARTAPSGPFGGRVRAPASRAPAALGHGVDIQEIAAMPDPAGERAADPFYAGHFTPGELAGAATRPDPKSHLCGLWCAKEAIRKSDPELAGLPFQEIAIEHAANGAPQACLAGTAAARFAISLSISHSVAYAVASAITQRR